MNKTKIKKLKPIDTDVHFKYRCYECGLDYWISLKEAKTKGFKIVCDCGIVFAPKPIEDISIIYKQKIVQQSEDENFAKEDNQKQAIPVDILNQCGKILSGYGFTESESKDMLVKSYEESGICDKTLLIKHCLKNLGETIDG